MKKNAIINLLGRVFNRFKKRQKPEDLLEIAGHIGPEIDNLVMDLFRTHAQKLMTESITYIVPAVWGATKGGALDETQSLIYARVLPVVEEVKRSFGLDGMRAAQDFALGFLIRTCIISKMTYLVESFRNQMEKPVRVDDPPDDFMIRVKPLGTA